MSQPWERRDDEPAKVYEAFLAYKGVGVSRTLKATAEKTGFSTSILSEWSKGYAWEFRVDQWDGYTQALRARAQEKRAEREAQLEAKTVSNLVRSAAILSQRMLKGILADKSYSAGVQTTRELASDAIRLSRMVRGEVTDRQELVVQDARKMLAERMQRLADATKRSAPPRKPHVLPSEEEGDDDGKASQ